MQEERRRGLAVRAGDGGDLELVRRRAEECVRGRRHGSADARHHELRNVDGYGPLDHERDCSTGHCPVGELVAVHSEAGHAEEQRARCDSPRVVGEVVHLHHRRVHDLTRLESRSETVELHVPGNASAVT